MNCGCLAQVKWSADAVHFPQNNWKSSPEQRYPLHSDLSGRYPLNASALLEKVRVEKKKILCLFNKLHCHEDTWAISSANVVMGTWLHQVARQPQGTDLVHFGNFLLDRSKENGSTVYSLPIWWLPISSAKLLALFLVSSEEFSVPM